MISKYEIQFVQELSLLNFGLVYQKLNSKQQMKIACEFSKIRHLSDDKKERYLINKLMERRK